MRTAPLLSILLLIVGFAPPAAASSVCGTRGSGANLRSAPSLHARRVNAFPDGEKVTVVGASASGQWTQVRVGGRSGWIASDYVCGARSSDAPSPGTGTSATSGANPDSDVSDGPSPSATPSQAPSSDACPVADAPPARDPMEGVDPWCAACVASRLESLGGTLGQAIDTADAVSRVEDTIAALLRAEETGEKAPDWDNITVDSGGLTYGAFQADRRSGELAAVLNRYLADPNARHAKSIGPYARALSRGERWPDRSADLKRLLRAAGSDPAMQRAQESYFREHHLRPGMAEAAAAGLRTPLGAALWLDLKVNGGLDSVVATARRTVGSIDSPGDEARFIRAMLDAREARFRALARKSSMRQYLKGWLSRNGDFRRLLDAGQLDLAGEVRVASKGFSICGGSQDDARVFKRNLGTVAMLPLRAP